MAPSPPPGPDTTSGPRRMALIAAATILGGMIAAVSVIGSDSLETRLTVSAQMALDEAGYCSVQVHFQGREASLSSETVTASRLEAAERIVEGVDGVRWATALSGPVGASPADQSSPKPSSSKPSSPPPPAPKPTPTPDATTLMWLADTEVLFTADSTVLTDAALAQLSSVAEIMGDYPELKLTVTGHIAIPTGTEAEAIAFSKKRASAVVEQLIDLGVSEARLTVVGAGASEPVGDNATAEGAALNRRVTFAVQDDL